MTGEMFSYASEEARQWGDRGPSLALPVENFLVWHTGPDGSTRVDKLRCTLIEARRAACEDYPDSIDVKLTRDDRELTPVTI